MDRNPLAQPSQGSFVFRKSAEGLRSLLVWEKNKLPSLSRHAFLCRDREEPGVGPKRAESHMSFAAQVTTVLFLCRSL